VETVEAVEMWKKLWKLLYGIGCLRLGLVVSPLFSGRLIGELGIIEKPGEGPWRLRGEPPTKI